MAEARVSVNKKEFLCAVCLDLLKDPVAIPCGHSYCKSCITDCWYQEDQMRVYRCPRCRHTFSPRPASARKSMLAEVVKKLKKRKRPADCYAGAGDVQCDVCTGRKYKAVKSCLVCLESYCQNHLQQHESVLKGKRHNLTEATGRLKKMICQKHKKILEVFCRTDQKCICVLCTMYDHKNHDIIPAADQRTKKQKELKETQKMFQQRIQQKEKDLQQLREAVGSYKRFSQTAVKYGKRLFVDLIRSISRSLSELIRLIRDQEKQAVSGAEGQLERLEQEINDLRRRDAELEQLSHTQDHIQFLQSFQSLSAPPESTDVNYDLLSPILSFDALIESVHQLRVKLEDFCKEELKNVSDRVNHGPPLSSGSRPSAPPSPYINPALTRTVPRNEPLKNISDRVNHGPPPSSGSGPSAPPSPYINPALTRTVPRNEPLKNISDRVNHGPPLLTNIHRNDFLKYSHQFTLDLNTVNKRLCLSENNRVITVSDTDQSYPDHPDRFDKYFQVLCRESVSGPCYWETEWSGDDFGVYISVSYKSIVRKGRVDECRFGSNGQSWSFYCSPSSYVFWHNNIKTDLSVKPIGRRIGVFVDHSEGTLSFFSVSDKMRLIHIVQTTFTQPLYPGFYVCIGSSVKLC